MLACIVPPRVRVINRRQSGLRIVTVSSPDPRALMTASARCRHRRAQRNISRPRERWSDVRTRLDETGNRLSVVHRLADLLRERANAGRGAMARAFSRKVSTIRPTFLLAFAISACVRGAPASIQNGAAERELGQVDFNHGTVNSTGRSGFRGYGSAISIDTRSSPHHVYVGDAENNRVLGWNDSTKLNNGAPADLVIGQPDFFSSECDDGVAPSDINGMGADSICGPFAVAVDSKGNLYIADGDDNRVLEYNAPFATCDGSFPCVGPPANLVFGQGDTGSSFTTFDCDGEPNPPMANATTLCEPFGLAVDAAGNLYVSDLGNSRVLEYDGPFGPGQVNDVTADLVFGQGATGTSFTTDVCANGLGISATGMCNPAGLAFDPAGNLYVADQGNNRVLEYDGPFGPSRVNDVTVDLVFGKGAGGNNFTSGTCTGGFHGFAPTATGLCVPIGVALDSGGNLYVADAPNNRILQYDGPFGAGQVNDVTAHRVYGQGSSGTNFNSKSCADGSNSHPAPSEESLCSPTGVSIDGADLYVLDDGNFRAVVFDNALANFTAHLELGQKDFTHNMLNLGGPAALFVPSAVAVDRRSVPNHLYITDEGNQRVLGYRDAAGFTNHAPADIVLGQRDFFSANPDGGQASPTATGFDQPEGLAVDKRGNLFVADEFNNRVLVFADPFAYSGPLPEPASVVFGQGSNSDNFTQPPNLDCMFGNTPPSATSLCFPTWVAVDNRGNVYISDSENNRVLEFDTPLANASSPNVTANLVFGQGAAGTNFTANTCSGAYSGPPTSAVGLCRPWGLAVDARGDLFVADGANRVLEYNGPFGARNSNDVTADLVFGQGAERNNFTGAACADGFQSDPAPSATGMCSPLGLAIDFAQNLFVTDSHNNRILEFRGPFGLGEKNNVTAVRVFGQGEPTNFGANECIGGFFHGRGFPKQTMPSRSGLCGPFDVAVGAFGDLFIADTGNNRGTAYDLAAPIPPTTPDARN